MRNWTDQEVEIILGNFLRAGVIVAAIVVLLGGILYLLSHGAKLPDYRVFQGEPADLRSITGILKEVIDLSPKAIIQLGLLFLIATPVTRVILSIYGFMHQKDRTYIIVTVIVLMILLYSLAGGF
jgi:uncharacterized membrane protein